MTIRPQGRRKSFPDGKCLILLILTGGYFRALSYTYEPFTKRKEGVKLALGDRMPSADTKQRRGTRQKAVLPVRIKGKDSSGKEFDELAHTLDVTTGGLRLGSVRRELNAQDEITVFYRQRKLTFRVVWTKKLKGTSEFQVGLEAVALDRDALGVSFPEFKGEPVSPAVPQASGAA